MAEELLADRLTKLESTIATRLDNFGTKLDEDLANTRATLKRNVNDSTALITDGILSMRRIIIDNLVRDNRHLHTRVRSLEDRLLKLEKQMNTTEQNQRKNNVEIAGIPANIGDGMLRSTVANIINHVTVSEVTEADIEATHRLFSKKSPKPTIVRIKRNLIDEIKSKDNKEKIKEIPTKLGFPNGTRIFFNDNQSPNMKELAFNARLLKTQGKISDTWFSNAAVRIRCFDEDKARKITHKQDLYNLFPNFSDFTFDREFYQRIEEDKEIDRYDDLEGAWSNYIENEEIGIFSTKTVETADPVVPGKSDGQLHAPVDGTPWTLVPSHSHNTRNKKKSST